MKNKEDKKVNHNTYKSKYFTPNVISDCLDWRSLFFKNYTNKEKVISYALCLVFLLMAAVPLFTGRWLIEQMEEFDLKPLEDALASFTAIIALCCSFSMIVLSVWKRWTRKVEARILLEKLDTDFQEENTLISSREFNSVIHDFYCDEIHGICLKTGVALTSEKICILLRYFSRFRAFSNRSLMLEDSKLFVVLVPIVISTCINVFFQHASSLMFIKTISIGSACLFYILFVIMPFLNFGNRNTSWIIEALVAYDLHYN